MAKTKSFEELLDETEELVDLLESGEMPLDKSLKAYEKGIANLRSCAGLLGKAEETVKLLVQETEEAFRLEALPDGDEEEEA